MIIDSDTLRRSGCISILVLVTLLVAPANSLPAQLVQQSYGNARIVGTVRDAVTGRMVLRAEACSTFDTGNNKSARRCVGPDSAGHFDLSGLPPGTNTFHVSCPGRRRMLDRPLLLRREVLPGDSEPLRIEVAVDATACDMRPYAIRSGVFEGIYYSAFEAEALVSCDGAVHGWPRFSQVDMEKLRQLNLPVAVSHTYYVRWEGVFRGPGSFGHLGGSMFGIDVTRVLTVREATKDDCASTRAAMKRRPAAPEDVHRLWWNAVISADTATVVALSAPALAVTLADGKNMGLAALVNRVSATPRGATALWESETSQRIGNVNVVVNAQLTGTDLRRPGVLGVQTVLERHRSGWRVVAAQSTPVAAFSPTDGYVVYGEFDGDYRSQRGARVQVWSRDSLVILAVHSDNRDATLQTAARARYRPIGPGLFEADQVDAAGTVKQLMFARDRTGKVTTMSVMSPGIVSSYSRTY